MPLQVVATLGVPGSASTWVFNAVRELNLLRDGRGTAESFFSDAVERVWPVFRAHAQLDRNVVWKLHEPSGPWAGFLADNAIPLVFSVRDPRDAMVSTMERFGERSDRAFERVQAAFAAIAEGLHHRHMLLRYEDGFFQQPPTVGRIASFLGIPASLAQQARIFATYRTDNVKLFAQTLDTRADPEVKRRDAMHYDETTQIHRSHIGDQRIGKWRDQLGAADRATLTRRFSPFLTLFGYDRD